MWDGMASCRLTVISRLPRARMDPALPLDDRPPPHPRSSCWRPHQPGEDGGKRTIIVMSVLVTVFSTFLFQVEILCDITHFIRKESKWFPSTFRLLINWLVQVFLLVKFPKSRFRFTAMVNQAHNKVAWFQSWEMRNQPKKFHSCCKLAFKIFISDLDFIVLLITHITTLHCTATYFKYLIEEICLDEFHALCI